MSVAPRLRATALGPSGIAALATDCLKRELATHPKPGLVSHVDDGAHRDMGFALLTLSADTLTPYFCRLAEAGAAGAPMGQLRALGVAAEAAMLEATRGVNTHRGALFGMGLLCAAAGFRASCQLASPLSHVIVSRWGKAILDGPISLHSHGAQAGRRHGVGGARLEAARGLPSVYGVGLPALRSGRRLARDEEAARVHACMALIAHVDDTNLLHRGGADGLAFAKAQAAAFLAAGGVGQNGWRARATALHASFVAKGLSPGGSGDLLAMTLFVDALER
jgi:triphosphoribosyl-dephospho-CoA synthase